MNGEEESIPEGGRTERCLKEMRAIRKSYEVRLSFKFFPSLCFAVKLNLARSLPQTGQRFLPSSPLFLPTPHRIRKQFPYRSRTRFIRFRSLSTHRDSLNSLHPPYPRHFNLRSLPYRSSRVGIRLSINVWWIRRMGNGRERRRIRFNRL